MKNLLKTLWRLYIQKKPSKDWKNSLIMCPSQCYLDMGNNITLYMRWRHEDPWQFSVIQNLDGPDPDEERWYGVSPALEFAHDDYKKAQLWFEKWYLWYGLNARVNFSVQEATYGLPRDEKECAIRDKFYSMEPFKSIADIPTLPVVRPAFYKTVIVPHLIRCGAIPKDKLKKNCLYAGSCRNTTIAIWDGKRFEYSRTKFNNTFTDHINHFQDDDGYDVFIPIKKL